jgi:hypothetical protein
MQLILAEFCGRWGCTWWENIINLIVASAGLPGIILLLFLILLPVIFLVTVFTQVFLFFYRLIDRKEYVTNSDSSQTIEPQILSAGISAGKFVGRRGIKFINRKFKERQTTQDEEN